MLNDQDRCRADQRLRGVCLPSTQLVEKKAIFLVSSGFSFVKSGDRVCGSDSPVSEELSTCHAHTQEGAVGTLASSQAQTACCSTMPHRWPYLAAVGRDDSEISRDPVPTFHLHQIPDDDFFCVYAHFFTVANDQGLLWEQKTVYTVTSDKDGGQHQGVVKARKAKLPSDP